MIFNVNNYAHFIQQKIMMLSTITLLSSEAALPSDLMNLHTPYQQPSDWHLFHVENVQSPYFLPSKPLGMVFSHTIENINMLDKF